MKPFVALSSALLLFVGIWLIPSAQPQKEHRYQHSVVDLMLEGNVLRTDGLTKISNNTVLHLVSVQDDHMPDPIVFRFKGRARPSQSLYFSILGTIDLVSVQKIEKVMNDTQFSPYLLLNDDPLTLNIDVLSSNDLFAIIKTCNTGRTQLLAKR
ncbi:hypothetical protein AB4393_23445 [Vibrio splendidus]|uniref:Uncharacterized protein n=1 Tax=Vibrio splendidus TaxID=29497 RepID=A0A2N7F7C6_VIBSP|nr:hypothetical protein [Vibrio splendidus]OMO23514.1 hypothetical protein BH581_19225 [Vibrio splendidus]PMH04172.1 hypothetical protein BCU75_04615 [Vibrio splendidus]PMJ61796.1 hypothetical protein BCU17_05520 [Vibrio splendidus]PMK15871.1 hypothetical protein BCU10_13845 [Vibrio splendidus]